MKLSRYEMVCAYMILGGIPYYLNYIASGKSLAQSIDAMFFSNSAALRFECDRLFMATFANHEMIKKIVQALNGRGIGLTRDEIAAEIKQGSGGALTEALNALVASDMVVRYTPFGLDKRTSFYKLVDPFCIFYLRFVEKSDSLNDSFWIENTMSQSIVTWRGLAFENVCFNHIEQIKKSLGINGISTRQSAWTKRNDDIGGTQIDLIIERKDNEVNSCEMKFVSDKFTVTKEYQRILMNREELLQKEISPKASIHNTLITTYGLRYNEYSSSFDNVVTLDDLFG